jgi:hypothetical protein
MEEVKGERGEIYKEFCGFYCDNELSEEETDCSYNARRRN